ncbi:hypothetical protein J3R82DRAFT_3442 [Butyriboletus roseoflavus]|nr:hypothetical protein J3R82DRAFT_3442 [Butyriboletus roseoflavus]
MADIVCPSCGKIVKGQHGLSLHTRRWCPNLNTSLTSLLHEHQEHVKTTLEERQRRLQLEKEQLEEREQRERK